MSDKALFPLCCTAQVPPDVIDRFLDAALAGSEKLVPNSEPVFALVTRSENVLVVPTTAAQPPTQPLECPFPDSSAQDIARQLDPDVGFFVILDQTSITDSIVVLVERVDQDKVRTVRATFDSAQHVLVALRVASTGFEEVQGIAASTGNVYGVPRDSSPQKGAPAPRKALGGR